MSARPFDGDATRVVVVDDHPVFRIGMTALLEELTGVEVVGEADSHRAAVRLVVERSPDVVVMDLDLDGDSGAAATREILAHRPETAVLVVTGSADDESLFAAVRAGARGYLVKGADADEVERAVRSVAAGTLVLGPEVATRALDHLVTARQARGGPFADLTERERDVLELVSRGYDNATVARILALSSKTVRNYVYSIFAKVGVVDRGELVALALDEGVGVRRPAERGPVG